MKKIDFYPVSIWDNVQELESQRSSDLETTTLAVFLTQLTGYVMITLFLAT